jgi:hypothetical protein
MCTCLLPPHPQAISHSLLIKKYKITNFEDLMKPKCSGKVMVEQGHYWGPLKYWFFQICRVFVANQ